MKRVPNSISGPTLITYAASEAQMGCVLLSFSAVSCNPVITSMVVWFIFADIAASKKKRKTFLDAPILQLNMIWKMASLENAAALL